MNKIKYLLVLSFLTLNFNTQWCSKTPNRAEQRATIAATRQKASLEAQKKRIECAAAIAAARKQAALEVQKKIAERAKARKEHCEKIKKEAHNKRIAQRALARKPVTATAVAPAQPKPATLKSNDPCERYHNCSANGDCCGCGCGGCAGYDPRFSSFGPDKNS